MIFEKIGCNILKTLGIIKLSFLFFLCLGTFNLQIGQKSKIVKILDSNLFELYDGSLVKLANVDVPNINHPNELLREIGYDAFNYAKSVLLNRNYMLSYPVSEISDSNFKLIHIIKEYPFETRDYTETYLENGFGKFLANAESSSRDKYILAEKAAFLDREGIWELNISKSDTLDQNFLGKDLITEIALDTMRESPFMGSIFSNLSNPERVILEVISAPILGVPFAFLGGLAAAGLSSFGGSEGWDNLGYAIIGAYLGYTLGNAAGVYLVAKNGEKEVTFGETFLASACGAAVGAAIYLSIDNYNEFTYFAYSPIVLPGLFAIIYSNIIADDKLENNNSEYAMYKLNKNNLSLSHKDVYNSKQLFEMEVFRIKF